MFPKKMLGVIAVEHAIEKIEFTETVVGAVSAGNRLVVSDEINRQIEKQQIHRRSACSIVLSKMADYSLQMETTQAYGSKDYGTPAREAPTAEYMGIPVVVMDIPGIFVLVG